MEKWANKNLIKFKGKHKVLQMGRNNPTHQHKLGINWGQSSLAEKNLGVLASKKLTIS